MALIRWIVAIGVLSIWAALIGTALYVALYDPSETLPEAEAIVVVAGEAGKNGGLGPETQARIQRAVALYEDGLAPQIIMSGGTATANEPVAAAMQSVAASAGVPAEALTVEAEARSTLQNAMFVADLEELANEAPILLVSHRYHLPRANAAFRWAGFTDVTSVAADANAGFELGLTTLWEGLKWPYDVLRAGAASAAMAGDVPRESYISYLE